MKIAVFTAALASTEPVAQAWDAPFCALDESASQPLEPATAVEPEPRMCSLETGPILHVGFVPTAGAGDEAVDAATARQALAAARSLVREGAYDQAVLNLRLVEQAFPRVADRIALERGKALLASGDAARALEAFELARESLDNRIRGLARVERVRALIRTDARDAESELRGLLRYYPHLPEALALRLEVAARDEANGDIRSAARSYLNIDLHNPGTTAAAEARRRLAALEATGESVGALTLTQQVERAERFVAQGPFDDARVELERLFEQSLPTDLRKRVALAAARIARIEGRWDDAQRYLQIARAGGGIPGGDAEEVQRQLDRVRNAAAAVTVRERDWAQDQIDRVRRRRSWRRVPSLQVRKIVEIAARAGLTEPLNEALEAMRGRSNVHAQVRFDMGILASGIADDALVAEVLEPLLTHPRYDVRARYHYARALERQGHWVDAEREFLQVSSADDGDTPFYRMWAEQRLWAVREAMVCNCGPQEMAERALARRELRQDVHGQPVALASLQALVDPSVRPLLPNHHEGTMPASAVPRLAPQQPDVEALLARLAPIVEAHGEAYPWFGRAADMMRLGDPEAAVDELHEAYLAWRHALGRPLWRAGLEAVYRGEERPRVAVSWKTRRERRRLDEASRHVIADIGSQLGDEGIAVGMIGWSHANARPRAYEPIVREAARRHGLDPNLLLAVMRVESVYQKRIVSYAGAVGLMQIMPRTGRLIADAMGRDDFTTADLLDPETNIEFAAWYLASLIQRWDGRLPLAIASYNGGPHNVRRWLRDHGEDMSLDAFLERIPFSQTHRYVRRVLTHYAAYRGQLGLPMERLTTILPEPSPDQVAF